MIKILLLACATCFAIADAAFAEDASLAARLQQIAADSQINASITVTLRGETLLSSGYGWANREHDVPNAPQTKHRIGSVTKQFTAMAILILEDRGKLRVEDPVGEHVSGIPDAWRQLTIHQLLTHTSGLTHSWSVPEFAESCGPPKSLDETLAIFHDVPLLFKPGTAFRYSGVGYFLLAKVIEELSGQTYAEFLRQEIFEPLEMESTGVDRADVVLKHRASGYTTNEGGEIVNAPEFPMPMLTGGGNLYSTVEDLARWDRAVRDRKLVSADAYAKLFRPEREDYAYGWIVSGGDRPTVSHSGGVSGFAAFILRYPNEELCVVVLSNQRPGNVRDVALRLADEVLSELDRANN